MTGSVPRQRSSTAASASSTNLSLIGELKPLIEYLFVDGAPATTSEPLRSLLRKADNLQRVRQTLIDAPYPGQAKDVFRHHNGFQALLSILRSVSCFYTAKEVSSDSTEELLNLFSATLGLLSESLKDHRGNRRYFTKRAASGGWTVLKKIIQGMGDSTILRDGPEKQRHKDRFFGTLYAFALGDETLDNLFISLRKYVDKRDSQDTPGMPAAENKNANGHQHKSERVGIDSTQGQTALQLIQNRLRDLLGSKHYWQNPEVVPALVTVLLEQGRDNGLYEPAHDTTILSVWAAFCHLATSSHYNLVAVQSTGIISVVLSNLSGSSISYSYTPLLWSLAEELIGLGINTLDDAYFLYRKASNSPDFAQFILKALRTSRSPAHIQFDLSLQGYASVELPNLGHTFPPSSPSVGYTLSVWLRIDKFDPNSHTTVFGAFDTSQTCFVLVYLERDTRNLILQTSVTSSKPSVRFKSMNFEERQWYHVCISHKRPRKISSSRASLFVNGEFVEQVKSQYPSKPPTSHPSTESFDPSASSKSKLYPIQAFFGTPQDLASRFGRGAVLTRWSLASAQLFSEILSDDLIAVHYQLGPRYSGNFQDCLGSFQTYKASAALNLRNETLHPGNVDKSDIVLAIRQKAGGLLPESRIILNISPTAVFDDDDHYNVDGSQLVNYLSKSAAKNLRHLTHSGGNTVVVNGAVPAINEALTQPHGVAILTGNPIVVIPQSLDDASWRIGGCVAVGLKLVEVATTREAIVRAVEILFESIKGSWRNSEAMERENGFGVLAGLLRGKTGIGQGFPNTESGDSAEFSGSIEEREKLVVDLLSLILTFVGYDAANPEDSIINNPLAYRILLVDLDVWRQATLRVQQLYYEQLITFGMQCKNHNFNAKRLSRMRRDLSFFLCSNTS